MAMSTENTMRPTAPEQAVADVVKPRARLASHSWNADGTPVDPDAEIVGAEAPEAPVQPAEPPAPVVAAPAGGNWQGPVQAAVAAVQPQ